MEDLEFIPGSGNEGRVTKKDILRYIENKKGGAPAPAEEVISVHYPTVTQVETKEVKPAPAPSRIPIGARDEVIEMDRMRKIIADHMVMSKHTSPHVTSIAEADVTGMVRWREKHKEEFEKKSGVKLTFTPLFVEAVVQAIHEFPVINGSVDGNRIIIHKDIHVGVAVALGTAGLIVPVIKNADEKNLTGLAKSVTALAAKARDSQLSPDDISGGTFTITNIGSFGSLMGTPIINQPQAAILGTGAIKKRPVVIESKDGDTIGIRSMMYISLSYDHRIIDGALGGAFMNKLVEILENFDESRKI